MVESQKFCKNCGRDVLARRPGTNHILHLLLSVLTAGLWVIVWFLVFLDNTGKWRCSVCGNKI